MIGGESYESAQYWSESWAMVTRFQLYTWSISLSLLHGDSPHFIPSNNWLNQCDELPKMTETIFEKKLT